MPRPWTPDDDHKLRGMYTRIDMPMQLIRDTLHRSGPDIHERARRLGLQRPQRPGREQHRPPLNRHVSPVLPQASTRLAQAAATTLRRCGYAPVYAQRGSDLSTKETGLWVVGARLMTLDELVELARKYERR
jgi:hypothetical protein